MKFGILKLSIVKPCQANLLIKDLLGDHVIIAEVLYFID